MPRENEKLILQWQVYCTCIIIASLGLFSISQKTLWPLLVALLWINWNHHEPFSNRTNLIGFLHDHLAWALPGLAFTLLAAKNAFNDITTGLISGQGELSASISRATLYLLAPAALCWINRQSIHSLATSAQSLFIGLQLKVATCLALTPLITGKLARKGFLLQFPTLKVDVSTWTGTYFLVSAGLACVFLWCERKDGKSARFSNLLVACSLTLGIFSAYSLQNLSCTIASLLLAVLLLRKSLKTKRIAILLAGISAALLAARDTHFVEELRLKQLLTKNDRLEFFIQGAKRFITTPYSSSYAFDGPPEFQRPICFKAEEVTFTTGDSCHNYWHTILWDSLRNSGYAGLLLALTILTTLAKSLYKAISNHQRLIAVALCCCLFVMFTTPIVEVGAGEVLPLMLLIALIAQAQSDDGRPVAPMNSASSSA